MQCGWCPGTLLVLLGAGTPCRIGPIKQAIYFPLSKKEVHWWNIESTIEPFAGTNGKNNEWRQDADSWVSAVSPFKLLSKPPPQSVSPCLSPSLRFFFGGAALSMKNLNSKPLVKPIQPKLQWHHGVIQPVLPYNHPILCHDSWPHSVWSTPLAAEAFISIILCINIQYLAFNSVDKLCVDTSTVKLVSKAVHFKWQNPPAGCCSSFPCPFETAPCPSLRKPQWPHVKATCAVFHSSPQPEWSKVCLDSQRG